MSKLDINKVKHRGVVLLLEDLNEMWINWMKKAGLNVLGIHDRVLKDYDCVESTIKFVRSEKGKKILSLAADQNIDIEFELHALSWLLPRSEFARHPEWFREDENGIRTPIDNMCATNKNALNYVRENAKRLAGILIPTTNTYHLWADDVENAMCNCSECRKYSGSDQNLLIMNEIIKGIKEVNKDAKLAYLAYADSIDVPRLVKPEDGIFLEFAPIKRRWDRAFNDNMTPENQSYAKILDELISFFGVNNAQVLEYWLDCSLFSKWKKPAVKLPFNLNVLKEDIYFYRSKGFDHISTFGAFIDEEYYNRFGMPPVIEYGEAINT